MTFAEWLGEVAATAAVGACFFWSLHRDHVRLNRTGWASWVAAIVAIIASVAFVGIGLAWAPVGIVVLFGIMSALGSGHPSRLIPSAHRTDGEQWKPSPGNFLYQFRNPPTQLQQVKLFIGALGVIAVLFAVVAIVSAIG